MKYIFIGNGDYYNHGEIKHTYNEFIFVKLNSIEGPPSLKLYNLSLLALEDEVFFFDTGEDLNEFVEWLETPSEESVKFKILNFKKDKPNG